MSRYAWLDSPSKVVDPNTPRKVHKLTDADLSQVCAYLCRDMRLHGVKTLNGHQYTIDPGKLAAAIDFAKRQEAK